MDWTYLLTAVSSGGIGALASKILDRRSDHERLAWDRVAKLEGRLDELGRQLDRTQDMLRESQSAEVRLLGRIETLEREKADLLEGYQRRGHEVDELRAEVDALRRQIGPAPVHHELHEAPADPMATLLRPEDIL